jgi:hypothetical protein
MFVKKTALAVVVTIIFLSGILTGCNSGIVTTTPGTTATTESWYQQIAHQLKAIQPFEVPANLVPATGQKNGSEFDVNKIFSVLTHLSMQEGYVLDYVFLSDGAQGGPILYVRPVGTTPFKTYDEYKQATHEFPRPDYNLTLVWLVKGAATTTFGNKITTDGTKEGYYEYALLQTLANQFYLLGNARVNDKMVVADSSELEAILTKIENSKNWAKIDGTFKKSARALKLQPVVEVADAGISIQLVMFSKWGGFSTLSMVINREYPYMVTNNALETVLNYNCGLNPKSVPADSNNQSY